jgi:hypothetical protein
VKEELYILNACKDCTNKCKQKSCIKDAEVFCKKYNEQKSAKKSAKDKKVVNK